MGTREFMHWSEPASVIRRLSKKPWPVNSCEPATTATVGTKAWMSWVFCPTVQTWILDS